MLDFWTAQSEFQDHYSDNKEILRLMDKYDTFLVESNEHSMGGSIGDYVDSSINLEVPWDLLKHLTTLCLIRKVSKLGEKRGLALLLGNEYAEAIDRGKKVLKGAKKGHAVIHGNKSELNERKKEYQKKINALHEKNKNLSYTQLSIKGGEYFDVSAKTIRNHTHSPIKKKK